MYKRKLDGGIPICDCCGHGVGWTRAIRWALKKRLLCFACVVKGEGQGDEASHP